MIYENDDSGRLQAVYYVPNRNPPNGKRVKDAIVGSEGAGAVYLLNAFHNFSLPDC